MNTYDIIFVGSFSHRHINAVTSGVSKNPPARSLGTRCLVEFYLKQHLNQRSYIEAQFAQLPVYHFGNKLITLQTLAYAESLGLKIHVWTINQADEMQKLIDLDVDGIMTDYCVLLKSVLKRNGLWEAL